MIETERKKQRGGCRERRMYEIDTERERERDVDRQTGRMDKMEKAEREER